MLGLARVKRQRGIRPASEGRIIMRTSGHLPGKDTLKRESSNISKKSQL